MGGAGLGWDGGGMGVGHKAGGLWRLVEFLIMVSILDRLQFL